MKLGLMGKSIQYSLSPKIHTYWLDKYQIPGSYDLIDGDFVDIIKIIKRGDYSGLNVTTPYKTQVLDLIPEWTGPLNAVNTLIFTKDHSLTAKNTDFETILEIFTQSPPSRVIILGSGGAAKAMIYAAELMGWGEIHVCSRSPLSGNFHWHPWTERDGIISLGGILINATSLKDDGVVGSIDCLRDVSLLVDLTYDPQNPPFLTKRAELHGINIITGKEFLLRQAQKSFYLWTGITPEITSDLQEFI